MLPTNFRYIWPNGFRGEESKKSANQKQELPVVAMFANGSGWIEQSFLRTFKFPQSRMKGEQHRLRPLSL
jgi:hypothetical protein